ncbi:MAG: hypothetical protein Q4D60_07365 [Eubacteriales bacterium]|nr:hypothetical protein [Eubacteriales bacterium]
MGYRKITIIGESNLCRSFMAAAILRGILKKKNISDIEVISRGLVVLFSEPVSQRAVNVLRKYDYEVEESRSSPLTEEDLLSSDLALTMTDEQAEKVRKEYGTETTCMSVGTFIDMEGNVPGIHSENAEDFEASLHGLESLMEAVAERIIGELIP